MEYLPIIFVVAIILCLLLLLKRKPKATPQKPKHRLFPNMIVKDIIGKDIMKLAETDKVNIIATIM